MTTPTVGRVVHFYPAAGEKYHKEAPLTALIAHVWSDTCVNLAIFDPHGRPFNSPPSSVRLVQPDEDTPAGGHYCKWMPYQITKSHGSESGEKEVGLIEPKGVAAVLAQGK